MARSDEIFVVHDVHCLTQGDVAVIPRGCSWITVDVDRSPSSRCVLEGRNITRNRFELYACGHITRAMDRGDPRGQTGGRRPYVWW